MKLGNMAVRFSSDDAVLKAFSCEGTRRALSAVSAGQIIRFDAMTGAQLQAESGQVDVGGRPVLDDKWYGTIAAMGVAVGPFDRKSQAMNGLALVLIGGEDFCPVVLQTPAPIEDVVEADASTWTTGQWTCSSTTEAVAFVERTLRTLREREVDPLTVLRVVGTLVADIMAKWVPEKTELAVTLSGGDDGVQIKVEQAN
jgi:hypothetical protein